MGCSLQTGRWMPVVQQTIDVAAQSFVQVRARQTDVEYRYRSFDARGRRAPSLRLLEASFGAVVYRRVVRLNGNPQKVQEALGGIALAIVDDESLTIREQDAGLTYDAFAQIS